MVMFPANPKRLDPYKNFKYRLKWDGAYIAGISKMSTLKRTTEVVEHRGGFARQHAQEHLSRTLQRGWTAGDGVQDLPLLGFGVSGDARP